MLRIAEPLALMKVLHLLSVPINVAFDEQAPGGYYDAALARRAEEYARQNGLFVNHIGPDRVVIWEREIRLGKESIRRDGGNILVKYHSIDDWTELRNSYDALKTLAAVPSMSFDEPKLVVQRYVPGTTLYSSEVLPMYKHLLIQFLHGMNRLGLAHRDLHCKNILVDGTGLWVIDWDFVAANRCSLRDAYDVTGRGLVSPHLTRNTHIFKNWPHINVASVATILGIRMEDLAT